MKTLSLSIYYVYRGYTIGAFVVFHHICSFFILIINLSNIFCSKPSEPVNNAEDEFESMSWQKVTVILESVQEKKKLENYHVLLPVTFNLMSR